ncbi:hypothetical protein FBQ96_06990 [Nitrospirales bacterium NOB]|nr:hypothetical protein [Nitrospirota bacterium]MDL1889314.1 hypothetical protein [Nitrospirales bacterium NOB]
MANSTVSRTGLLVHSFLLSTVALFPCLAAPTWAEALDPAAEAVPATGSSEVSSGDQAESHELQETPDSAAPPVSPSVQISGSIWRSKPGIVFLQTPIGPLSLSSKTSLRDIRNSHKITLWVHGTTSVIDIRERGAGTLVHRYISAPANFSSGDQTTLTLWTPEGDRPISLGNFASKVAARPDHLPVALEVDQAGNVRGLHEVQFDLQVNQVPRTQSEVRLLLNGTVSKLKSNYVFLKTPLGIVTVSGKTGVRNAKAGQEMSVWVQERHVAIDLYQDSLSTPSRRFLSGPLAYESEARGSLLMHTPEGAQAIPLTQRPSALAALKEGTPITVELDQDGGLVDVRRVN